MPRIKGERLLIPFSILRKSFRFAIESPSGPSIRRSKSSTIYGTGKSRPRMPCDRNATIQIPSLFHRARLAPNPHPLQDLIEFLEKIGFESIREFTYPIFESILASIRSLFSKRIHKGQSTNLSNKKSKPLTFILQIL